MADHVWTVICSRLIVDKGTNQVTLVDIAEKLKVFSTAEDIQAIEEASPGETLLVPVQLGIGSEWVRSDLSAPEVSRFRLVRIAPDGSEGAANEFPLDLAETLRRRVLLHVTSFPVRAIAGLHWFEVQRPKSSGGWETVARVPLEVELVGHEGSAGKPG